MTRPQVGELFLYTDGKSAPQKATVTNVTPSGMIETDLTGKDKFRPSRLWDGSGYFPHKTDKCDDRCLYAYSAKLEAKFKEDWSRHESALAEKREKQAKLDADRQARREAELAETKKAFGHDLTSVIDSKRTLKDGARLFFISVKVKEELRERRGDTIFASVKLANDKDWQGATRKTAAHVACTDGGNTNGFSIGSWSPGFDSDEDALWAIVNDLYGRWW